MTGGESQKNKIKVKIKALKYSCLHFLHGSFNFLKRSFRRKAAAGGVAVGLVAILIFQLFFQNTPGTFAGTYTFLQTAWTYVSGAGASHPGNQTGFSDYGSKVII
jgi:hypothetical protein